MTIQQTVAAIVACIGVGCLIPSAAWRLHDARKAARKSFYAPAAQCDFVITIFGRRLNPDALDHRLALLGILLLSISLTWLYSQSSE